MCFNFKKWEDNSSPTIRVVRIVRIVLLVMIFVGVALLVTQDSWVPQLVNYILTK